MNNLLRIWLFGLGVTGLGGCSTLPVAIEYDPVESPCNGTQEFFVLSHGWHTGIALDAKDLNNAIPELAERFPNALYYEIGWGDTGFYQAPAITTELTLRAMFWSDGSVIHVVGLNESPVSYFKNSDVRKVRDSAEGYEHLIAFIKSSFKTDQSGAILPENHGIYGDSQFYTGNGTYQIFNTCNKWTAKAVRSAGYDISTTLKLTSSAVMASLPSVCERGTPDGAISN